MFEPENDIERLLMRASTQAAEWPGFARALMDAQTFVVLVPDRPVVPGPDGNTTIAEGTKLSLPSAVRGEDFTPPEVKRMLAGQFGQGPQTAITQAPEQILLAHPKQIPAALIEALAREFEGLKSVRGAWLMLAMRAGASEQSWMLGVDHKGSWQEVRDEIGRAVAGDVLGGRMLDARSLDSGELSVTLRTGIHITAAKRGFLQKLFR